MKPRRNASLREPENKLSARDELMRVQKYPVSRPSIYDSFVTGINQSPLGNAYSAQRILMMAPISFFQHWSVIETYALQL